jgi:thymidylate synthase
MLYYNKRMDRFSDDGITINSAYGARIFNEEYGDQFRYVVKELCSDPHSRRATLHVNRPADLRHAVSNGSKDVPCTMNLQLFIRDRKLHMSVHMRSNDVIWGMPYDVFSFTMLQECFLAFLIEAKADVDGLGTYHHSAGSIHIYDEFLEQGAAIELEEITAPPPMDPFDIIRIDQISHLHEPVIMKQGSTLPEDELSTWDRSSRWLYDRLVEQHLKRKEENERNT